jgi:hypothetical protein
MNDDQQAEGRLSEFAGGQYGGGTGVHTATAIPAQQANPDFQPASILMAANQFSGAGLGSSDSTLRISDPYAVAMRDALKQSGSGTV